MVRVKRFAYLVLVLALFMGHGAMGAQSGCLASWEPWCASVQALVEYVSDVTDPNSPNFVPVEDRVAVFDMDGTLYGEKAPVYLVWIFYAYRVTEDPGYSATQEQRAVAQKIIKAMETGKIPEGLDNELADCGAQVFAGMSIDEFTRYAKNFLDRDTRIFANLKYADMWYRPMREVIDYLNANCFTTYICTGTDRYLARAMAEGKVAILPQHIIGMDVQLEASGQNGTDGVEYNYTQTDEVLRTEKKFSTEC